MRDRVRIRVRVRVGIRFRVIVRVFGLELHRGLTARDWRRDAHHLG